MNKTTYFRSIAGFFLKGILLCFFTYLLIERTASINIEKIKICSYTSLIVCFLLTPLNWFFEWLKWKEILIAIDEKNNSNNSTAFASGIVSSFLTPSFSGNFLGRMFYYDKSKRWKITSHSISANFTQFILSVAFGIFGIQITPNLFDLENWIILVLWTIVISSVILYFFGEKILNNVPFTKLQSQLIQMKKGPSRTKIFLISFLRYLVFVAQYALALQAFGEKINLTLLALIAIIFLLITLTPSLFFGKIVVRESIAVSVFCAAELGPLPAAYASFTTWLFNLLIPTMIALIFVKNKK